MSSNLIHRLCLSVHDNQDTLNYVKATIIYYETFLLLFLSTNKMLLFVQINDYHFDTDI